MTSSYKRVITEMNRAYNELNLLLSQELKAEFGLTGQQENLIYYIHLNKNTTANQIASTFQISKSAVSQAISKLEKHDMISKQENPNNKREYFLTLGSNGIEFIERLSQLDDLLIEKYFSKLEIETLQQMTDIVIKTNQMIREEKKKCLEPKE